MALAERTWERVGERKRDRARLIESADNLTELILLYFCGAIGLLFASKYEIISLVEQDISRLFALLTCEIPCMVNTRNKFHISTHPCIFSI